MSFIQNLRTVADKLRLTLNLPALETHAAILAFALVHPKTGAVVCSIDPVTGLLLTPSGSFANAAIVTTSTPLTGFSKSFNTTNADELVNLTPAGTLATGTIVFPSDANSRIGQKLSLTSSQTVTALTVTSAGLTLNGIAVTSLAPGVVVSWTKTAASTWQRTDALGQASGQTITAPVVAGGLTASGSAANDFSASTGPFKTSTGLNTLGGPLALTLNASVVTAAASPAALGAQNTQQVLGITGQTGYGVQLLAAEAGFRQRIYNQSAFTLKLLPETGGTINGLSANASITIPASTGVDVECLATGTWLASDLGVRPTS